MNKVSFALDLKNMKCFTEYSCKCAFLIPPF